jgi:hypothetical protein
LTLKLNKLLILAVTAFNFSLAVNAQNANAPISPPVITVPSGAAAIEQRNQGTQPSAVLAESFDGLGVGFEGPRGTANLRNPSDNSLAVGKDHIFQIVNTRMAIFTKKGKRYKSTGTVLYGPAPTNSLFKGFGGICEATNNGDAVVRYDQLADRWLVVMPIFRRGPERPDQPKPGRSGDPAQLSVPGRANQPGAAVPLFIPERQLAQPPQPRPPEQAAPSQGTQTRPPTTQGPYSMCYAISTGPDPMGSYYRYEFRIDKDRSINLHQQGTYAPDGFYRWMASPAVDRFGNIGIGYSFGGSPNFAGQRFAGRRAKDPLGQLSLKETVLIEGEGAQNSTRWEDYTQTAVDPSDDCTI